MKEQALGLKPSSDKAGIYVIRKYNVVGSAVLWDISLDNQDFGSLKTSSYLYNAVIPGEHSVGMPVFNGKGDMSFLTRPDKNYFITVKPGWAGADFSLISEMDGERYIRKFKMSGNSHYQRPFLDAFHTAAFRGGDIGIPVQPICQAARNDDLEKVKALIQNNPNLLFISDDDGMTPLEWAMLNSHRDVAEWLLADGADVNARDYWHWTPLHFATLFGRKDVAELLLTNKADINARDLNNETPLHFAAQKDNENMVELLLANKADVNARDSNGETPLHLAAMARLTGDKDIVQLLLANKADVNARDNGGATPLHYAAIDINSDICEALISAGAQIDLKNNSGQDPLDMAMSVPQLTTAAALVNAGATFVMATNTLDGRFHSGIYQKLLADKQASENKDIEAKGNYADALAELMAAQAEYSHQADVDNKKATRKEESQEIVMAILGGMAQGVAATAANMNTYNSYRNMAQISALRNSSTPAQYPVLYNSMMAGYHPAVNVTYMPNVSTPAASSVVEDLRAQASELEWKAAFCQKLTIEIQQKLK